MDLSTYYSYAQEFWGEFYYKSYGEMTAQEARRRCELDGASLPVPRSPLKMLFMLIYIQMVKYGLGLPQCMTAVLITSTTLVKKTVKIADLNQS